MTEHDNLHSRIDRMEAKIDKLVDAMTELVKLQPTINAINERLQAHAVQIDNLDKRQDKVEQKIPIYDLLVTWVSRVGIAVSIAIALAMIAATINIG